MRHRSTPTASVLMLALSATLALAQTSSAPPEPGPEVKKLGAFVGKWTIAGSVPAGAMGSNGGQTTGTADCEWVAERFGVFCREMIPLPGTGSLTDVYLMGYDGEAKNYLFTQVSAGGGVMTGRGAVNGDTWTWTVDTRADGKPIYFRFTDKWTSPDSFDFKNEIGDNPDSMKLMMTGKQSRIKASAAKP